MTGQQFAEGLLPGEGFFTVQPVRRRKMISKRSKTPEKPHQWRKRSYLSFSFFLTWLLRLWSDFCSKLPNRAFSSFALQGEGSKRQRRRCVPAAEGVRRVRVSPLQAGARQRVQSSAHCVWCLLPLKVVFLRSELSWSVLCAGGRLLISALLGDITALGQWRERSLRNRRLLDTDFLSD